MNHIQSETLNRSAAIRWLGRRLGKNFTPVSSDELARQCKDIPQFYTVDIDECYRQGFEEGFDYAIERFEYLYCKKGFVRVREICNILLSWSDKVLRDWRYVGEGRFRNYEVHHPIHSQVESWSDIRERIIRRDQKCVRCGDVLKLEVDHIKEVQEGGLPEDGNLQTLCKVCHKGKRIWNDKSQGSGVKA